MSPVPDPYRSGRTRCVFLCLLICAVLFLCALHSPQSATASDRVIRVVMDDSYPPYAFKNAEGRLQGILVDQWQLWQQKTGIRAEVTGMDWADAQRRMQAGEYDVIDTIFRTESREKIYDFTPPYARLDVPLYVHADIGGIRGVQDAQGFLVGAKAGDAAVEYLHRHGIRSIAEYPSYELLVAAARDGKLKVFTVDRPPALYFLNKLGIQDRFRETAPLYSGEFHRAVAKGNAELLSLLESGFSAITPVEYQGIEKKWYGSTIGSGFTLKYLAAAAGAAGLIILILLAWTITLKRAVSRRTAELAASERRFQTIFDSVNDAIFIHDINTGAIVDVNRRMCEMYGMTRDEALQMRVAEISTKEPPYTPDDALQWLNKAADGKPQQFEWRARHKDGHLFWVEVSMRRASIGNVDRILVSVRDIAERKRQVEALEHVNTCFTQALNSPRHVLYRLNVRKGGYDYLSPAFEQITGHPVAEFSQKSLAEVKEYFHPDDQVRVFAALDEAFLTRSGPAVTFELEYRMRKADGTYCWLHDSTTAVFDDLGALECFYGSAHDVTERKRYEEELRMTRVSVDAATDAIFWIRPDAGFMDVNPAACRSLGYSREELLLLSVADVDPHYTADLWQQHFPELRKRCALKFESEHRTKDGRVFPVEIVANYVQFGTDEFNCAFVRDISERRLAEQERRSLEQQVLHAQKLESLGVLAGGIAHDFNNILTAIIGNAELARRRLNPESPGLENLQRIEQAASRAADLARQMLAYSGKGHFVIEAIDLNRLVEEMGHMLEVSITKKATLRYNLTRPLPTVSADATQLRQIVMNLVINASEAIGDHNGVISIATGTRECTAAYLKSAWLADPLPSGDYVWLEIADTGCGMDEETMSKLFDPFFTTKFTGRGLGMAAVLGIVRGHMGAIKVESVPGKGTTFTVLLPAGEQPAAQNPDSYAHEEWRGSGTVLLVDDENTVLAIGSEMLRELGFGVLTASDGVEALAIYRARCEEISLVILDLTMPQMDGEQCFQELKRIDPQVKVIMSSGFSESEVMRHFAGQSLANFVQKPYRLSELRSSIMRSGIAGIEREGSCPH